MENLEQSIVAGATRREELARDLAQAHADLETARADLVAGRAKTPAKVTAAQATATALAEAVDALDRQLVEQRADLATAQAQAADEATRQRLVQATADAAAGRAQFEAGLRAANTALEAALSQMLDGFAAWTVARESFRCELDAHTPGMGRLVFRSDPPAEQRLDATLADLEQRGADLPAVLAYWLWHGRTYREYDYRLPDVAYGGPIMQAFDYARGAAATNRVVADYQATAAAQSFETLLSST